MSESKWRQDLMRKHGMLPARRLCERAGMRGLIRISGLREQSLNVLVALGAVFPCPAGR
jgi:hypothetical protein